MWANVMAGGGGFEWYLKRSGQGHAFDHSLENFSEFDAHWVQSGHVVSFWRDLVQGDGVDPQALQPMNNITDTDTDWVLGAAGQAYVIFLREGGSTNLDLTGHSGDFEVTWFDPRTGASTGAAAVSGGSDVDLGMPPSDSDADWVMFVRQ